MAVVFLAGPPWTERHNMAQCQDLNEAGCYQLFTPSNHIYSWFQTFSVLWMSYSFFLAIPPVSEYYVPTLRNTQSVRSSQVVWKWWKTGTRLLGLSQFFLLTWTPKKEQCSKTSVHKIRMPRYHPREIIRQTTLKSLPSSAIATHSWT